MDETTDSAGSGPANPQPDAVEPWEEEFEAMLDAMPTIDRLSRRLARLQRRYRTSVESDEPQGDTMREIAAELEEIREEMKGLPVYVPPPAP